MFVEQLPSGRWRGGFRVGGRGGRRVTQTFDYEYEAEAWALEAEARAKAAAAGATPAQEATSAAVPAAATAPAPGRPPLTVGAHAADWLARKAGGWERATEQWYAGAVAGINATSIDPQDPRRLLGKQQLVDLKRSDVERWQTLMRKAGVGAPTINARLKVLRMIFVDAMEEKLADVNPAASVGYLAISAAPDRVLTREEDERLLAAADPQLRLAILLGLDAGLRWQEVYALTTHSVRDGYVVVYQGVARLTRELKSTKSGTSRNVPIGTDRLREALEDAVAHTEPGGLLLPALNGGVMDYNNHRRSLWKPAVRAAKLKPQPGFHALRHTFGSRLAAAGVPRSEIAKVMGHADEETTKRYIHAGDDGRRAELVTAALAAA